MTCTTIYSLKKARKQQVKCHLTQNPTICLEPESNFRILWIHSESSMESFWSPSSSPFTLFSSKSISTWWKAQEWDNANQSNHFFLCHSSTSALKNTHCIGWFSSYTLTTNVFGNFKLLSYLSNYCYTIDLSWSITTISQLFGFFCKHFHPRKLTLEGITLNTMFFFLLFFIYF